MAGSNEHDIQVVNSLITTTIDSADGFERSAENARGQRFESMFVEFGAERRDVVDRLQQHVTSLGGSPNDDGSLKADLHRRFEDLRTAIGGGDKAVIEEVERGEDYIKGKYETALADDKLSAGTRAIVELAFQSVRAGHDRASQLKHSLQGQGMQS